MSRSTNPAAGGEEVRGCEEELRAFARIRSGDIDIEAELLRRAAALKGHVEKLLFAASSVECNRMAAIPQGAFAVFQVRKNFDRSAAATFASSNYHEEQQHHQKQQQQENNNPRDNRSNAFNAKVLQDEGRELTPLKYNSKLMNSIWGLYNRYSVHNFKKIDANEPADLVAGAWAYYWSSPADKAVAEVPAARIIGASQHHVAGH